MAGTGCPGTAGTPALTTGDDSNAGPFPVGFDFPFDGVKIHRSLFAETTDVQNEAMMRTIYASADVLGFDIIHVGIDAADELAAIEALAPRVGREVLYVQGAVVQDRLAA